MTAVNEPPLPAISIRCARRNEHQKTAAVAVNAFSRLKKLLTDENWLLMEHGIHKTTAIGPKGKLLVATLSDEIVGSVRYTGPGHGGHVIYPDDFAYLRALAVSQTCLRCGVGAKLTMACIDRARLDGATALGLHVAAANHSARALYEKLGFTYHSEAPEYFGIQYKVYLRWF